MTETGLSENWMEDEANSDGVRKRSVVLSLSLCAEFGALRLASLFHSEAATAAATTVASTGEAPALKAARTHTYV